MALLPLLQFGGGGASGTLPVTFAATSHEWINSYTSSTGMFTGTQPAFTDISGTIALGQTALTTAGDLLYANATPALARLAIGSAGNVLTVSGGLPSWAAPAAVAWSSLGNAAGALTLSNGANATTFDQTSAVAWLWANTTAAVSGTAASSPLLELTGAYWTGSASVTSTWSIQAVQGNSTTISGSSYLTLAQAAGGSSSSASGVAVPIISSTAATGGPFVNGGIAFSGTLATGAASLAAFGAISASRFGLYPSASASVNQNCELDFFTCTATDGHNTSWSIVAAANNGANASLVISAQQGVSGQNIVLECALGTSTVAPGIVLGGDGGNNNLDFKATSGTQVAVSVGLASGLGRVEFDPASGQAQFIAFQVIPIINSTSPGLAISNAVITSATVATVTVPATTGFVVGQKVTISGVTTAGFTGLNGTWVLASAAATTLTLTTSGLSTKSSASCNGDVLFGMWSPTQGSYTALLVNPVETAAPGAYNLLADFQVGGVSKFSVDDKGHVSAGAAVSGTINKDCAGQVTITAGNTTQAVSFASSFLCTGQPIIVATPTGDPVTSAPALTGWWVTYSGGAGAWTGFTINIGAALAGNITFNYCIIGTV